MYTISINQEAIAEKVWVVNWNPDGSQNLGYPCLPWISEFVFTKNAVFFGNDLTNRCHLLGTF